MASLLGAMNLCSPPPTSCLKSHNLSLKFSFDPLKAKPKSRSHNSLPPYSLKFSSDPLKGKPKIWSQLEPVSIGSLQKVSGCNGPWVLRGPRYASVILSCPFGGGEGRTNEDIYQIFEDWCKEHEIRYASDEEKQARFQVFKYNYEYVQQHNQFTIAPHSLCLGPFSDRTANELGPLILGDGAQVISCKDVESLNELLAENNELTVVACTAKWCRPCVLMEKVLQDLAPKMPVVSFVEVDVVVDELKAIAVEKWEVEELPTILLVKNGQVVDKVTGARKDEFYLKLAMHVGLPWGHVLAAMWNSP